jgi:phage terminase Nu1 subunit (DNA packaging protein)
MADLVPLREFGRMIGVSGEAVRKAVDSGRIPKEAMGEIVLKTGKTRPAISNVEMAIASWGANTNQNHAGQRGKVRADKAAEPEQREAKESPLAAPGNAAVGASGFAKAKAVRETFQAKLAQLEYEEKSGKLISTEKVRIAQFTQGQLIREAVLNMPDRIASQLAAELGRDISAHVVRTVMDTELRNILIEVAKFGRSNAN